MLSQLLELRSFLRRFDDDDDMVALDAFAASFCRLPGEVGVLDPLSVFIDAHHRRALEGIGDALEVCMTAYLVDSDRDVVMAGPATMRWDRDPPIASGSVLVRGFGTPTHSHYTPFDAGGFRIERGGKAVFVALRVAQEVGEHSTRLIDRATGVSTTIAGTVSYAPREWNEWPPYRAPDRFHVEVRPFSRDHLAGVREDLETLVFAALETGCPVELLDRFGGF